MYCTKGGEPASSPQTMSIAKEWLISAIEPHAVTLSIDVVHCLSWAPIEGGES